MSLDLTNMNRVRAGLPQMIDDALQETGQAIKAIRDPLTPVDTGELLASDILEQIAPGHWRYSEGNGLPDARSVWTEFGTRYQAAQPHFTPAVEQVDMPAIMEKHLNALIGGG